MIYIALFWSIIFILAFVRIEYVNNEEIFWLEVFLKFGNTRFKLFEFKINKKK